MTEYWFFKALESGEEEKEEPSDIWETTEKFIKLLDQTCENSNVPICFKNGINKVMFIFEEWWRWNNSLDNDWVLKTVLKWKSIVSHQVNFHSYHGCENWFSKIVEWYQHLDKIDFTRWLWNFQNIFELKLNKSWSIKTLCFYGLHELSLEQLEILLISIRDSYLNFTIEDVYISGTKLTYFDGIEMVENLNLSFKIMID